MSVTVAIRHSTKYIYERHIELSPQVVRLRPAPHTRTAIKGYSLVIKPDDHFINWQQDPFGNYLARLVFPNKVKEFSVDVEVIADLVVVNPFDFFMEESAKHFPFTYSADTSKDLLPYLEKEPIAKSMTTWLADLNQVITEDMNTIDFLVAVNQKLNQDIEYRIRMEPGVQTCQETLSTASGSCRDSAWLLVQILRQLGLAARFVSGYLVQLKPDEKPLEGPAGPEEDFTDLHAWTEVYIPGAGWIGLDPTSGLFAGEGHIPLACTPSPQSAAPISGIVEQCETTFLFENRVDRIVEKPRVTKPYTVEEWKEIIEVGHQVEQDLQNNDVRLTMGGEPTFVATDNQDAPEWNTSADGEHKRELASALFGKLKDAFAPGALMQYGQGKWYPAEPLPRWKLACYWRKDGLPIWKNAALFADFTAEAHLDKQASHRLINEIVKELHLNPSNLMPAFEDPFYFIWEEQKLPTDLDPFELDMDGKLERQKLAEVLNHGLEKPVAYTIPIRWNKQLERWESCRWELKRKHLFLTPGNSPAGLRLPLDSIDFSAEDDSLLDQKDPFAESPTLPSLDQIDETIQEAYLDSDEIFKSSLVVEVRDGKLFVFMPPTVLLEHYLTLIHIIEKSAAKLQLPLIVEGYDPPDDDRLQKFMVTPDPGVIEVNVHPSSTWQELLNIYQELFKASKACGLTSEKFNLDGKHTGTGGGNHVTLGGKKPADSPLLRRPDLLQSLVTYWQHHPSLSYLFSTQFIGPTSQAPRVDEGRDEMLYELELAFSQVPNHQQDEKIPFWLVDRLFRNLLIDVTGNTHRAEFCIDKLYSPDTSSGRLGILEFRGFDMPPHEQMCLVQLLLIRALVAKFWQEPYRKKLVRWGTSLHDRFLLPHYCRQDLKEVIDDLSSVGYTFDLSWFDPFFSFRFPFVGELQAGDINVEISMAIEPWHVLGEEISSTGTARFVDSSLERIQVKVSGMTDGRYYLLCNGCKIPLQKTATHGTFVAGIRYRAWQPPSALHPNLGVDTPLVFDLYDTWSDKSVAACKYHVAHPGGRSYDTFPVNSLEAEARRNSRFFDFGHSINLAETIKTQPQVMGRLVTEIKQPPKTGPIAEIENPEYPFTMDLRRYKSL